MNRNTEAF